MLLGFALLAAIGSSQDVGDDVTLLQLSKSPILEKDVQAHVEADAELDSKLMKHNKELAFVEGLAHSVLEKHEKIDDAAKEALAAINATIDNSLELINASHLTDQSLLNTQAADAKGCLDTFRTENKANIKDKKTAEELETSHSSCRATIGVDDDGVKEKCDALTNFLNGLTPPNCALPTDQGTTSVSAYWTSYKAFHDNNFETWQAKDKACTEAKEAEASEEDTCDALQSEFETAICAVNLAQLSSCHTYTNCASVAQEDFDTTVESVQSQAQRRRIEYKAAVKIQCYIKILLADDSTEDSIEACQTMDPDVSHLILKVPNLPKVKECDSSGMQTLPCTDDFTAKYDGMLGINECTPCPALPEYLLPECPEGEEDPGADSETGWMSLQDVTLEASSSWSGSYLPDNIKTADTNPWHCYGHGTDEWIKLTFDKTVALSGFRTKMHCSWDGSSFKNYKFQYSSDGNTWKDAIVGVGENQDCGPWQEITFPKKTGKYWRLYMVDNHGYGWLSLEQMEVQSGGSAAKCKVTPGPTEWDETMSDVTLEASSSWSGSYMPDNMKKPDTNPWHCHGHGVNQWIKMTLPSATALSGFRVKMHCSWDGSSFKNYKFQYSANGNDWQNAKVGVGENQDCGPWQEITFPRKTAKYWRLYMDDNWGYGWLSIEQMQLQKSLGDAPAIPTGPATFVGMDSVTLEASSSWSGSYLPDNMKTPDTNPWHDAQSGVNQWIKITLPEEQTLSGFRVKMHCSWDGSSFKNYMFQYSDSGEDETWTNAKEGVGENQDCGPWQEITFPPKTAKFWRLFMKDNHGYGWLSIEQMELQRIGAAAAGSAPAPPACEGSDAPVLYPTPGAPSSSTWGSSTLVLQYGKTAYTPTTEAVGTVGVGSDFAKLSDAAINAIQTDGDSTYDYWMFHSDIQTNDNNKDVGRIFVRTKQDSYSDTGRNMGWGSDYWVCNKQDAASIDDCDSWTKGSCDRFDTQCVSGYAYDCRRWFMDYSGVGQCYTPSDTSKRCLSGNAPCKSCGGSSYGIRTNLRMYKFR